jgi:hypothetical protein
VWRGLAAWLGGAARPHSPAAAAARRGLSASQPGCGCGCGCGSASHTGVSRGQDISSNSASVMSQGPVEQRYSQISSEYAAPHGQ